MPDPTPSPSEAPLDNAAAEGETGSDPAPQFQTAEESRRSFLQRAKDVLGISSLGDFAPQAAEIKAARQAEVTEASKTSDAPPLDTAAEIERLRAEIERLKSRPSPAEEPDPAPEVPIVEEGRTYTPWELAAQREFGDDLSDDDLSRLATALEQRALYSRAADAAAEDPAKQATYQAQVQRLSEDLRREGRYLAQQRQLREVQAELAALKEPAPEPYDRAAGAQTVIDALSAETLAAELTPFAEAAPAVLHALRSDPAKRDAIRARLAEIEAKDAAAFLEAAEAELIQINRWLPEPPAPDSGPAAPRGASVRPPRQPPTPAARPSEYLSRDDSRRRLLERVLAR